MRLIFTTISIFALCFLPVFAQSEPTAIEECDVDNLQRWYDRLPGDAVEAAYGIVTDSTRPPQTRVNAQEVLAGFAPAQLETITADDDMCLTIAKTFAIYGWNALTEAGQGLLNQNTGEFLANYVIAMQRIGELRGYVMGHGVDIAIREAGIFYK